MIMQPTRTAKEQCREPGCSLSRNYSRYCRSHAVAHGVITDLCVAKDCIRSKRDGFSYCAWHNIGLDLTDPGWFDDVAVERFWAGRPVGRALTPLEWETVSQRAAVASLKEEDQEARFGVPVTRIRAWNRHLKNRRRDELRAQGRCGAQQHGDHVAYTHEGCRCPEAVRDQKRFKLTKANGTFKSKSLDATGTRRKIRSLMTLGWTQGDIGQRAGLSHAAVSALTRLPNVQERSAKRIDKAFNELSALPAPPSARASRARAIARREGWPPPLAWDNIDDPSEEPNWGEADSGAIDWVEMERALKGRLHRKLKPHEVYHLVSRLSHMSIRDAALLLHVDRLTVKRIRTELVA